MSNQRSEELTNLFNRYDNDETGIIKASDLKPIFDSYGIYFDTSAEDLKALEVKGSCNLSEFISVISVRLPSLEQIYSTRENELKEAFDMIDKDGSGSISAKELKYALLKFGQELSDVEHAQVMKKYDTNHDGKISFEEFKEIMKKYEDDA